MTWLQVNQPNLIFLGNKNHLMMVIWTMSYLGWLKTRDSSKWFIEIILGLVESHPSKNLYNLKNMFFSLIIESFVFFIWPVSRTFLPKACDRRPPPLTGNQGRMWPSRRWFVCGWTVDGRLSVPTEVLIQGGVATLALLIYKAIYKQPIS